MSGMIQIVLEFSKNTPNPKYCIVLKGTAAREFSFNRSTSFCKHGMELVRRVQRHVQLMMRKELGASENAFRNHYMRLGISSNIQL